MCTFLLVRPTFAKNPPNLICSEYCKPWNRAELHRHPLCWYKACRWMSLWLSPVCSYYSTNLCGIWLRNEESAIFHANCAIVPRSRVVVTEQIENRLVSMLFSRFISLQSFHWETWIGYICVSHELSVHVKSCISLWVARALWWYMSVVSDECVFDFVVTINDCIDITDNLLVFLVQIERYSLLVCDITALKR